MPTQPHKFCFSLQFYPFFKGKALATRLSSTDTILSILFGKNEQFSAKKNGAFKVGHFSEGGVRGGGGQNKGIMYKSLHASLFVTSRWPSSYGQTTKFTPLSHTNIPLFPAKMQTPDKRKENIINNNNNDNNNNNNHNPQKSNFFYSQRLIFSNNWFILIVNQNRLKIT